MESVNKEDIKAGPRTLGLKKGDSVGVHSSLRRFGNVEGGADAVIDALLEVVGQEGNIVMSTHSANVSEDRRTPEEIAMGVSWFLAHALWHVEVKLFQKRKELRWHVVRTKI